MGSKIRLQGWQKYKGGLDVNKDQTGEYSVFTEYEGHEIMFHVSTLLPFSHDDPQQVQYLCEFLKTSNEWHLLASRQRVFLLLLLIDSVAQALRPIF